MQPVSLDEIARICGFSKFYLCRYFKAGTGMTLQQYITHMRVALAQRLMLDEDRNVTQACYESGFSDPAYFIQVFSKLVGKTPKQWQLAQNTEAAMH